MSRHGIALPDEGRGWNLWSGRGAPSNGRELGEIAGNGADVAVGVPATESTTFAVTLPTTDATLFETMIFSQIEKRGLTTSSMDDTAFEFEVVHQEGNETLLSVDVLSPEFPEAWCLPRAAGYAPSARLLQLPENKLLIYREHRRLVLAAGDDDQECGTHQELLHVGPLVSLIRHQGPS